MFAVLTPGYDTTSRLDMIIIPSAASNNPFYIHKPATNLSRAFGIFITGGRDPVTQHNGQVYWEDRRKVSRPARTPTTGPFEISRTIWPALALTQLFCRRFIVRIFCSPLSLLCPLGFIKDPGSLLEPHNRGKIVWEVGKNGWMIKMLGKKVWSVNKSFGQLSRMRWAC